MILSVSSINFVLLEMPFMFALSAYIIIVLYIKDTNNSNCVNIKILTDLTVYLFSPGRHSAWKSIVSVNHF